MSSGLWLLWINQFHQKCEAKLLLTRLHSSRMRTARALTVSPSMLCGRCLLRRDVCSGGCLLPVGMCLLWGGVCSGGCLLLGGLLRGVCLPWEGSLLLGASAPRGVGGIPPCTAADPVMNAPEIVLKPAPVSDDLRFVFPSYASISAN